MQESALMKATDWDGYYSHPFPASHLTKYISAHRILATLERNGVHKSSAFIELGGGGSFFFPFCEERLKPQSYTIFEKNQAGIDIFLNRYGHIPGVQAIKNDLIIDEYPYTNADIVMSFGLIEHFNQSDTEQIIRKHFLMAKRGGVVLMTFPTPVQPYGLARGMAERLGMWQFPDERPVPISEVLSVCESYGRLLEVKINRFAVLTQAIAVWKVE